MLYLGRKRYHAVPKPLRDVFVPDAAVQLLLQIQELSEREIALELVKYGVPEKEVASMSDKVRRLILFDILSKQ
jgi:hypothetical protein